MKTGVALFRPKPLIQPQNADLADDLRRIGFDVHEFSLLQHQLVDFSCESVETPAAYLISSMTAIDALRLNKRVVVDVSKPVLAVGKQTAAAAQQFGFKNIFTGDGGMLKLVQDGLPWLQNKISGSTGTDKIAYISVTDPKHDPASLAFRQKIQPRLRPDLYEKFLSLGIEHWPVYQTLADVEAQKSLLKELKDILLKIKYLSFFSQRNASVFRQFCDTHVEQDAWLALELKRKTLVCNGKAIAEAVTQKDETSLFGQVRVTEKPNRQSYLNLMKSLIKLETE